MLSPPPTPPLYHPRRVGLKQRFTGGSATRVASHDDPAAIAALEARVAELERQLSFLDLLVIPRVREAAAAAVSHVVLGAEELPASASGFYPAEQTRGGITFRWTDHEPGGRLHIPLLRGMRYDGLLTVVRSPHVQGPADVVLAIGGSRLELGESGSAQPLALPFALVAQVSGLAEVVVTSTALFVPAERHADSTDQRRLGVQFSGIELMLLAEGAAGA
jgi:hypothetical protein